MKELNLTETEILKIIKEYHSPESNQGTTTNDIALALDISVKTTRKWLQEMKQKGIRFTTIDVIRYNIWDKPYKTKAIIGINWDKKNEEGSKE